MVVLVRCSHDAYERFLVKCLGSDISTRLVREHSARVNPSKGRKTELMKADATVAISSLFLCSPVSDFATTA